MERAGHLWGTLDVYDGLFGYLREYFELGSLRRFGFVGLILAGWAAYVAAVEAHFAARA